MDQVLEALKRIESKVDNLSEQVSAVEKKVN